MAGRRIDPSRYTEPGMMQTIFHQVRLSWRLLNDPRVPTALKMIIPALVVAYAVSPVDLIPDFLLGLGQLDDLGVLLAGLALFVRLAPPAVVAEHRSTMGGPVAEEKQASGGGDGEPLEAEYRVGGRRSSAGR